VKISGDGISVTGAFMKNLRKRILIS